MNACFSKSEAHLEKWRTLLLASLDVSVVQAVDTGLPRWFREYSPCHHPTPLVRGWHHPSRTAQVATLRIAGDNVWINGVLCLKGVPQRRQSARYRASDPLFSLFTSGSTGFLKGIVHGATGFLLYAHYTSNYFFGLGSHSTILCGAATGWINGHT